MFLTINQWRKKLKDVTCVNPSNHVESMDLSREGTYHIQQPNSMKGLENRKGEHNCFLNVVIQIMWHCEPFRNLFKKIHKDEHDHSRLPGGEEACVFCSLRNLFMNYEFSDDRVLLPEEVRMALSTAYQHSSKFQLHQMDDACEAFQAILTELNNSLVCSHIPVFDINVSEQTICGKCGERGEPLVYQTPCWYISVTEMVNLSNQRQRLKTSSFEKLFKLITESEEKNCISGECGKCKVRKYVLDVPSVLCIGLTWESGNVKSRQHRAMIALLRLRTSLKLKKMFAGIDTNQTAELISFIGYYGKHYVTVLKSSGCWYLVDDHKFRQLGSDDSMIEVVLAWKLQINALFYQVSDLQYTPQLIPKTASPLPKRIAESRHSLMDIRPTVLDFEDMNDDIVPSSPQLNSASLIPNVKYIHVVNKQQSKIDKSGPIIQSGRDEADSNQLADTTDTFGICIEGCMPIEICKVLSADACFCWIEADMLVRGRQTTVDLTRNLQLCLYVRRPDLLGPKPTKIFCQFQHSYEQCAKSARNAEKEWFQFGMLDLEQRSCFLTIPACLHRFQSFMVLFKIVE